MKCVEIRDKKLFLTERPQPRPQRGEVLVRVYAAGVNHADILQRKGSYPPPPGVTDIPGLEISGEISERGRGVSGLKTGQKICALVSGGGYAEYCAVPAALCLPLPKNMEFTAAAGIPETFFTVWTNLFDRGQMKKGQTILVHGGASGIGTTAIQIARAFGVRIFVTAGSEEKCQACKKLGAHLAINYNSRDFVPEVLKATKGRGVDIVLDMVGGDYIHRNLKVLGKGGRHVSIAMLRGRVAELDILQVMANRLILTGSALRPAGIEEKAAIAGALQKNIWPRLDRKGAFLSLFCKKRISPVIDKIFPLAEAQAAHDYLESGAHIGKVILRAV